MMMHLFKVEFVIMMLQGICLKVEFVEFVIQILKKAVSWRAKRRPIAGRLGAECSDANWPSHGPRTPGVRGAEPLRNRARAESFTAVHTEAPSCCQQEKLEIHH